MGRIIFMARTRNGPTLAELTLLGLLTDGPAHPYALDVKLKADGGPTDVAFSSVYAALARLEKLALVSSKAEDGERGKARRVYRLSPQGRTALRVAARDSLAKPMTGGHPNDLGVSNLLLLSRDEALAAIHEARVALKESKPQRAYEDEYPSDAVALHRTILHTAEERFYAELERLVERAHPERSRRRAEEE